MLRVWMLLVVGAAAMRQVAEDAVAHSAVKEEWDPDVRKKVEKVAKRKFPEEERHYRHYLIEAVMKAKDHGTLYEGREGRRGLMTAILQMHEDLRLVIKNAENKFQEKDQHHLREAVINAWVNGELDKGFKKECGAAKHLYLLTAMEQMQQDFELLKYQVNSVARKFPKKEQHRLKEAMMNAWEKRELELKGRMSSDDAFEERQEYLLKTMQELRELPVAASAIKFCSNLFRAANSEAKARHQILRLRRKAQKAKAERVNSETLRARRAWFKGGKAAGICHKVLTGELGADDGPEWAEKAAKSSQPKGQHYQLGRLQKVNATETAWKVSLKNVCKDECQALVEEIQKEAKIILSDVQDVTIGSHQRRPSYEEACAKRVVQKVEAEILGCCADSCGWNGRACMLWPFLNSTEKGQWEAECCTEFNILKNSSRATMCDSTLTGKENNEVIRDPQANSKKDREMIGQDPDSKGTSFLQGEDTNGPTPPPENTPIPRYEGTCPDPLKLGKEHSKLKDEWKTTNYQEAKKNHFKKGFCLTKPANVSIGNCTAFLPQGVDGGYVCYGECLGSVDGLVFTNLTDTVPPSVSQLLYVHKSISGE